jgi:hypothetical protein
MLRNVLRYVRVLVTPDWVLDPERVRRQGAKERVDGLYRWRLW